MVTQPKNAFILTFKRLLISSFVGAIGVVVPAAHAQTTTTQNQQSVGLPDRIVYYLNGQETSKVVVEALNPADIANMNVVKGANVSKVLGNVPGMKAVLITTKGNEDAPDVIELNKKLNRSAGLADKLLLVDGKEITLAEMEQLLPSQLQQITVLSPKDAVKAYGEKGRNGAVQITTK